MKLKTKLFTMRIGEAAYIEIQKYARANDLNVSQLIRKAVSFFIKKNMGRELKIKFKDEFNEPYIGDPPNDAWRWRGKREE